MISNKSTLMNNITIYTTFIIYYSSNVRRIKLNTFAINVSTRNYNRYI